MSLVNPGIDTRHVIEKFRNSKSLATLASEEDRYQSAIHGNPIQRESGPKKIHLYTKDDLENFKTLLKGKSTDEILELLGIEVTYNTDGSKSLSHYKWPFEGYSFASAGINEEELLNRVSEIKTNCDLTGSSLKNLGSVNKIGRNLTIPIFTKIEDLSNIKSIGGNIICDVENPLDAIDLIKKTKLNPQKIGGYIRTGGIPSYYNYTMSLPKDIDTAIKSLMAMQSENPY